MKLTLWCLILSILLTKINTYFYEQHLMPLSRHKGSMFGYGIAYQNTASNKSFLVSAPVADKVGKIFKISLDDYTEKEVAINVNGNRETTEYMKNVTYNHNFLLGASLVSGDNYVITCAPRITKDFIYDQNGNKIFGTFGICYYLNDTSEYFTVMHSAVNMQGNIMDGFGWSAHVTKEKEVFIGSPPMGKGRVLYYKSNTDSDPISKNITDETLAHNYGYSITSGHFLNKNKKAMLAVSSPYDTIGTGKVILFTKSKRKKTLTKNKELKDDVVGSLFGASMSAADLDGDGIDDLLVGAPAYQKVETQQWNIGAVHIYLEKLNKKKLLTGYVTKGYFGSSIVNIGDHDGDGCDDICIGAPYEGRGIVYVYSGAVLSKEKDIKWTQRIEPEEGHGFGVSLALLPNFENNGCNGLVVGAPDSDSVYIVHCIPMVKLTFETKIPNVHLLPVNTTNFDIESCFNVEYSKELQNIIADVVVKTEIDHLNEHAAIVNETDEPVYFQYETPLKIDKNKYCKNVNVNISEASQLLKYIIKAELKENATNVYPYNEFRVLLSPKSTLIDEGLISATRGCDGENCVSILNMNMHYNIRDYYMLGSTTTENLYISLNSSGETAYSSCVRINIFGVSVLKYPADCLKDRNNETTLICSPRTPLFKNDIWNSGNITLDMKTLTSSHKRIILTADLYYNCKMEKNTSLEKEIKLVANTSGIDIKNTSSFDPVIKFMSSDFEIERKPVEHTFMIINHGIVTWEGLEAKLSLEHKDYSIYTGVKVDNVKCDLPSNIKEERINLTCPLPILNVNSSTHISIQMDIIPKNLENHIKNKNITLETTLKVAFEQTNMNSSVSNLLVYQAPARVPFWVIILSSIIGLIVLLAIGYGMSEAGFFKRQTKQKLETLKQDVRRQSVIKRSSLMEAKQALKPVTPYQPLTEDANTS